MLMPTWEVDRQFPAGHCAQSFQKSSSGLRAHLRRLRRIRMGFRLVIPSADSGHRQPSSDGFAYSVFVSFYFEERGFAVVVYCLVVSFFC